MNLIEIYIEEYEKNSKQIKRYFSGANVKNNLPKINKLLKENQQCVKK